MEQWIYVSDYVLLFFLFSCAGWLMEVGLKYRQYHRWINRGYLVGPYCPIYGCGAVVVTVVVGGAIGYQGTFSDTFLAGFVACGLLEYFVSWLMEKLFHARWWDYSQKPMNLNGRIWIGNLVVFGLGAVVIVKAIDPLLFHWFDTVDPILRHLIAGCIIITMMADNVVSYTAMSIVKKDIDHTQGDNTEEISRKVRALVRNRKMLQRRILQAYPMLEARPKEFADELDAAKKEVKRISKELRQEMDERREELKERELAKAKERLQEIREKFNKYNS